MGLGKQKSGAEAAKIHSMAKDTGLNEQTLALMSAERSIQKYHNKRSVITEAPAQDFADDILARLQEAMENLSEKPKENELFTIESFTNVLMSARHINKVAKVLGGAGYSDDQIKEVLKKNYDQAEDAYVAARMDGKTDREARKVARRAQRTYLSSVHSSLGKRHRRRFERDSGAAIRQGEIAARALKTQNDKAIDAVFDAVTEEQQRKVVKDYELMSDFAADALFASTTMMFSSGAMGAALGEQTGADSPAQAGMEALDSFITEEQRAQGETKTWEDLDEQIEELLSKKAEEMDGKTQKGLGAYLVPEGASAKETAEYLSEAKERAQEETGRVQELRTPEKFVQDKEGNWTLEEDTREGAQYQKMPAFYPAAKAIEMINAAKPMIEQSKAEFSILAAREFAGDGIRHLGTAREVLELADFEDEAAPETLVMQALSNPGNETLNKGMEEVLANPLNVGIRAALLEAYARAVTELAEKREMAA